MLCPFTSEKIWFRIRESLIRGGTAGRQLVLASKTLPWNCRLRVGIVISAAVCIFGAIAATPAIRIFRAIRIPPTAAGSALNGFHLYRAKETGVAEAQT